MSIVLHGYRYACILRIVRMVLIEKGVSYSRVEVNPFASDMPKQYLNLHPFRRVPTLVHYDYVLYETQAITRYIDEAFAGPTFNQFSRASELAWRKSFRSSTPTGICRW